MRERDDLRPEGGDLNRDLEEKEAQVAVFESGAPDMVGKDPTAGAAKGAFGDSRPDESGPGEAQFVSADDPNLTSDRENFESPQRDSAEDLARVHRNETRVEGRPTGVDGAEQAVLLRNSETEAESGRDS